jgi:hypothetical protein
MNSGSPSRLARSCRGRFGVFSETTQCMKVLLLLLAGIGQKRSTPPLCDRRARSAEHW